MWAPKTDIYKRVDFLLYSLLHSINKNMIKMGQSHQLYNFRKGSGKWSSLLPFLGGFWAHYNIRLMCMGGHGKDLWTKRLWKMRFYVVKTGPQRYFSKILNVAVFYFFFKIINFCSTRAYFHVKWKTLKGFLKNWFWLLAPLDINVQCQSC